MFRSYDTKGHPPTEFYKLHYQLEKEFWYFLYKRDLVKEFIERVRLPKRFRGDILDIGCGTGSILQMLDGLGVSFGVDNNLSALHFCAKRGLTRLIAADVMGRIPFREERFDIVCALDLLEHLSLEGEEKCLDDIYRILKKDSYLILTLPAFGLLWSEHDLAAGHKRRYKKKELIKRLAFAGFTVERCTYFNCFLFPPVLLFRKFIRKLWSFKKNKKELYLDFDFHFPSLFTDVLFPAVSRIEKMALEYFDLPFGVSLICICRKGGRQRI